MIDVHIPATDGRCLVLPRFAESGSDLAFFLEKLKLTLPRSLRPRFTSANWWLYGKFLEIPEPRN